MSRLYALFVVSFAASLLMVGVGLIVALLPQRVLGFSGSLLSVGYLASVFALSYLVVQLPIGQLADRFGARSFLVVGYGLCGLSGLLFFFADSAAAILVGRLIQGAGEAPIWALGPAILARAYPHARGRMIGLYNAGIHTGLTLGPLLGVLLFPSGTGNLPFLVFAALCLSGGLIVLLGLPVASASAVSPAGRRAKRARLAPLLRLRGVQLALAGALLYGAGYGIFVSVLPASLALSKGFEGASIGLVFVTFYLAISVAQLVVGPLSDRFGRRAYMAAGMAMAGIGLATFDALPQLWALAPLGLASLGLGVFCVSSMAYLSDAVPDTAKATISAGFYLFWGLGYLIGPLVVGTLGEILHPQAGYLALAAPMLLLALALAFRRS